MRPLLIAALLAVGVALVGVIQVMNVPIAPGRSLGQPRRPGALLLLRRAMPRVMARGVERSPGLPPRRR